MLDEHYDTLVDIFRVINVALGIALLVLLQRSNHKQSYRWSGETIRLHKFMTALFVVLFLASIERILIDAKPAWNAFAQTAVYIYGTWVFYREEGTRNGRQHLHESASD